MPKYDLSKLKKPSKKQENYITQVAEEAEKKPEQKKKAGRKATIKEKRRSAFFYFTNKTLNRFTIATAQEIVKRKDKGERVDRSLLVEEALKEWLAKKGY